jgi:hypothetical protein
MSTAGHTKRITVNAVVLTAYSVGNAVGPFIWQAKYKPRNRVPFIVISACSVASACLLLAIRQYLAAQNRKKGEQAAAGSGKEDKDDGVYITVTEDGKTVEKRVDRVCFILIRSPSPRQTLFTRGDLTMSLFRLSKISQIFRIQSSVTYFKMPRGTEEF